MPLTHAHRRIITVAFCLVFYVLFLYKFSYGSLLFQLKPLVFHTRFDLFTLLLMKAGLHHWLMYNSAARLAFDIVFYSMPLVYLLFYLLDIRIASVIAVIMLIVNWVYIQCITLFPGASIEGYIAWVLFPVLFITVNLKSFYFVLHGLRYFLLYFFTSAAIWKFVQGGVFNIEQMSGILLFHHKEYLISSPHHWFTTFTYWLINHSLFSYLLYVGATALELFFITGFFTRKLDRMLAAALVLFLLLDQLIMRIPYWEMSPFLLTLLYSKYSIPVTPSGQHKTEGRHFYELGQ